MGHIEDIVRAQRAAALAKEEEIAFEIRVRAHLDQQRKAEDDAHDHPALYEFVLTLGTLTVDGLTQLGLPEVKIGNGFINTFRKGWFGRDIAVYDPDEYAYWDLWNDGLILRSDGRLFQTLLEGKSKGCHIPYGGTVERILNGYRALGNFIAKTATNASGEFSGGLNNDKILSDPRLTEIAAQLTERNRKHLHLPIRIALSQ